ncbi:MAG: hypothetical protein GY847_19900 [Proteobacteria bacterium]|nr:hypothetical protein [Pseudomonadota bacterium]
MLKKTLTGFGAVNLKVKHRNSKCRDHGAPVCEFVMSWEEDELLKLRKSAVPENPIPQ